MGGGGSEATALGSSLKNGRTVSIAASASSDNAGLSCGSVQPYVSNTDNIEMGAYLPFYIYFIFFRDHL